MARSNDAASDKPVQNGALAGPVEGGVEVVDCARAAEPAMRYAIAAMAARRVKAVGVSDAMAASL